MKCSHISLLIHSHASFSRKFPSNKLQERFLASVIPVLMQLSVMELGCVHRADPASGIHTYRENISPHLGCIHSRIINVFLFICRFLLSSTFGIWRPLLLCPACPRIKTGPFLATAKQTSAVWESCLLSPPYKIADNTWGLTLHLGLINTQFRRLRNTEGPRWYFMSSSFSSSVLHRQELVPSLCAMRSCSSLC